MINSLRAENGANLWGLCGLYKRKEARAQQAQQIVGDRTYRIWRLYLAGSAYYFQKALLGLYQTLLVKSARGQSGMPLTRSDC